MEGSNGVSGGGGGMLPASMGSEMQGLEMSLHHPHHTTTTPSHPNLNPNPHPQQQHHHHHHLLPFPPAAQRHEGVVVDHSHPPSLQQHQHQQLPSPWQRMKWTDSMVRLLIMIVYCVGDDASGTATDQGEQHGAAASASVKGKKAPPTTSTSASASASAGLLLQKKGKWKSVSRAMMEKGFYVSPQQCEDKFNDLNKRYKRVNELLGKGTACRVVENQALLDSLDHVSPKAKDEARKLLNSKHLFFREMCAYHNSSHPSSSTCAPALPQPPHSQPLQPFQSQSQSQSQQPHCLHHPSDSSISISFPGSREPLFAGKGRGHSSCSMLGGVNEEKDHHHDDNYIDDDDSGDDDDEVEGGGGGEGDYDDNDEEDLDKEGFDDNKSKQHQHQHDRRKKESKVEAKGTTSMLMLPTSPLSASPPLSLSLSSSPPAPVEQLRGDLMGSLASMGGEQQQKQWLKRKAAELEEQRVGYQCQALELERQRFKWLRFSSNKEREMDRMKLRNERLCLENDRMLLLLRQKEQELINASADAAPTTTTSSNHNPLQFSAVHHNLLH